VNRILCSTRIWTGDPARPWAEALGIRDGRIAAVGTEAEARAACPAADVVPLPGRLVTPGLVDAHLHFVNFGLHLGRIQLRGVPTVEACRERVREAVKRRPAGQWIIGRGWHEHEWPERREPTARDLDDIAPDHPVMLVRHCGHSVWLNSRAMAMAGIRRDTVDAPGARIERDDRGEPTGICREYRKIIEKIIPPPSLAERREAGLLAQREALRHGVTGVHSCETLQEWEALAAVDAQGALKVRVHHLLPPHEVETAIGRGLRLGHGSDHLWWGQVKLYADGSLGSGTALMHEPYADNPGERGLVVMDVPQLRERVELAYRHGGDVGIHAIGDLAVTNCLTAIRAARAAVPGTWRDRIEHVQVLQPSDLAAFRDMGVVASVQPVHLITDRPVAEKKWGLTRCRNAYPWKTLLRNRVQLQFGSDAPVEHINPLLSFHAAALRQDLAGEPAAGWFSEERLGLEEILHAFTVVPAWVSRKEGELGTLTPGKRADVAVFAEDLSRVPASRWTSVPVEMTLVDGEPAYREGSSC
jgi:predicted amidohydrolase YtcJ